MGLLESLKRAQEQGRQAVRRGVEEAGERWEDAQSRIRRKMRIHPRRSKVGERATSASSVAAGDNIKKTAA